MGGRRERVVRLCVLPCLAHRFVASSDGPLGVSAHIPGMSWLTRHNHARRLPPPVSAPPGAFAQLQAALERQTRWSAEFAAAGDLDSAVDARLDADAIGDELSGGAMP
jgi:hypothetical protein